MPGLLNDKATLYRRLPDGDDGTAQHRQELDGTVRDCARYLRDQPAEARDGFFAELSTGARLSAVEIERVANEEA
ncbi:MULTISPECIES: hypothetical protein [Sphingomonas]|uniref:Uncharacterized protein n=1 Tax=Sphingomonas kyungheensis TaxID=1069987 RepID=A0ABU8H7G9_9SPHN|nr:MULTISPECIES: hypothetical protein [unclassified Sphingomonas]EZP49842.1 hypothetical protein BW41_03389 [Sphingomonas sp. RIT328]